MKIEDWNKFSSNSSVISWIKNKDNFGLNPHLNGECISVEINTDWDWNKKRLKTGGYDFEVMNKGHKRDSKHFKTKSQALKFAKAYMRKH